MKGTIFSFFLALISITSYSQVPSNCSAPSILLSEYDVDVKDLALSRILFLETGDTAEIIIPTSYQDTIWDGLAAIFNLYSNVQRDSIFDAYCIHNSSPSNTSLFDEILVGVDNSYSWTAAWAGLNEVTGYTDLDNLVAAFGFTVTYYSGSFDYAILHTSQVINVNAFCDSLESFDGITYAEKNPDFGDADRIKYNRIGDNLYYDFTVGWSDCSSGCINKYTWKFLVNYTDCSVEYLGINFINGSPSEPFPAPINCNISGSLSAAETEKNDWRIYPSPANDHFIIESQESGIVEITNMNGEIIYFGSFEIGSERIDISNFSSGMYIIKLKTISGVYASQIIKQ